VTGSGTAAITGLQTLAGRRRARRKVRQQCRTGDARLRIGFAHARHRRGDVIVAGLRARDVVIELRGAERCATSRSGAPRQSGSALSVRQAAGSGGSGR
jgi:hypothetical protein